MYFINEKTGKRVKVCPDCGKGKVFPSIDFWEDCPPNCPGKKLEEEHQKVVYQMLDHVFPNLKIEIIFIKNLAELRKYEYYEEDYLAWSIPALKKLFLPWYILRSKYQFFNVMMHELAHFIAFQKKYSTEEGKIIGTILSFEMFPYLSETELMEWNFYEKNKELFKKYFKEWKESKRGHWYNPWWLSYKELFEDFYNSKFKKYTYGKISKPLKYGFSEDGEGEYKEEIVEYK